MCNIIYIKFEHKLILCITCEYISGKNINNTDINKTPLQDGDCFCGGREMSGVGGECNCMFFLL
jgi:hypothetical protein